MTTVWEPVSRPIGPFAAVQAQTRERHHEPLRSSRVVGPELLLIQPVGSPPAAYASRTTTTAGSSGDASRRWTRRDLFASVTLGLTGATVAQNDRDPTPSRVAEVRDGVKLQGELGRDVYRQVVEELRRGNALAADAFARLDARLASIETLLRERRDA